MRAVPSGFLSKADGFRPPGAGSGFADTQQASRSTSERVSGQADCEATGDGAGLAQAAANKAREISTTARFIGERLRIEVRIIAPGADAVHQLHDAIARLGKQVREMLQDTHQAPETLYSP